MVRAQAPNSIPLGNQACFHHTGLKTVREAVTSSVLGARRYDATKGLQNDLSSFSDVLQKISFNKIFFFLPTHRTSIWWKQNYTEERKQKNSVLFCAGRSGNSVIIGDSNIRFSMSVQIEIHKREIRSPIKALTLRENNATRHGQSLDSQFTAVHQTVFQASFVPSPSWCGLSSTLFSCGSLFVSTEPSASAVHTFCTCPHDAQTTKTEHNMYVGYRLGDEVMGRVSLWEPASSPVGREAGQRQWSTTTATVAGEE